MIVILNEFWIPCGNGVVVSDNLRRQVEPTSLKRHKPPQKNNDINSIPRRGISYNLISSIPIPNNLIFLMTSGSSFSRNSSRICLRTMSLASAEMK